MITIYWSEVATRALPEGGDAATMTVSRLDLDILEAETYDVAATITSHAVEAGVPISDHSLPAQDRVSATICVSGRQSSTTFVEGSRAGGFNGSDGWKGTGIIVPEGTDRIGDVHTTLRRLCREAVEVDVDGLMRPIEGWLIERVSSPRSAETAGLLVADITLVEVRYAEIEEVEAPSPRVERARRSRDRGRQQPSTTTTEAVSSDPSERQSSLSRIGEALGLIGAS